MQINFMIAFQTVSNTFRAFQNVVFQQTVLSTAGEVSLWWFCLAAVVPEVPCDSQKYRGPSGWIGVGDNLEIVVHYCNYMIKCFTKMYSGK